MQPLPGLSLFESAALKQLKHTAGNDSHKKTSGGLQPASQLHVSSPGLASSWVVVLLVAVLALVAYLVCVFIDRTFSRSSSSDAQVRQTTQGQQEGKASILNMQEALPALASTAAVSPHNTSSGEALGFLCKLLVVPPACESILHIPLNPKNSFHVMDQYGGPVIVVELKAGKHVPQERRRAEFLTREGIPVAQCEAIPVLDSGDQFHLFRGTGEYFATLAPDDPDEALKIHCVPERPRMAWKVQTPSGLQWFMRGYFESYSVEVTDVMGRVLAMLQPKDTDAGDTCLLRVAPHMDISIVLCGLVAVYHLRCT